MRNFISKNFPALVATRGVGNWQVGCGTVWRPATTASGRPRQSRGVSFDGGRTIYGFHPQKEALALLESEGVDILSFLKTGGAIRGQVFDDTSVFVRAYDLSTQGARTSVWQKSISLNPQQYQNIQEQISSELANGSPYPSWYRFPTPNGDPMPPQCNNCATWPRTLGISIPENTGQLNNYIPLLEGTGTPWMHGGS